MIFGVGPKKGGARMEKTPRRVLVVEDDLSLAKAVKMRLELEGFTVQAVHSGAAALACAAEHQPEVVVLDLRLPDMHGYEVCRELRRLATPWNMAIVMCTGMDKPIDQLRGYAFGADAYLVKPYDSRELIHSVKQLLGEEIPA